MQLPTNYYFMYLGAFHQSDVINVQRVGIIIAKNLDPGISRGRLKDHRELSPMLVILAVNKSSRGVVYVDPTLHLNINFERT